MSQQPENQRHSQGGPQEPMLGPPTALNVPKSWLPIIMAILMGGGAGLGANQLNHSKPMSEARVKVIATEITRNMLTRHSQTPRKDVVKLRETIARNNVKLEALNKKIDVLHKWLRVLVSKRMKR